MLWRTFSGSCCVINPESRHFLFHPRQGELWWAPKIVLYRCFMLFLQMEPAAFWEGMLYMACASFSKVNFETFMWDHPTLRKMFGTDWKCQPHHHELSFVPMFDSFRKCIPTRHASHGLLWWLVQRPQFNKFLQEKKSSLWWIISEADWAASESLQ